VLTAALTVQQESVNHNTPKFYNFYVSGNYQSDTSTVMLHNFRQRKSIYRSPHVIILSSAQTKKLFIMIKFPVTLIYHVQNSTNSLNCDKYKSQTDFTS